MYFCPKCNYSFDISKATSKEDNVETRKKLTDPVDALKRLKADKDMSKYVADFTMEELENNKHYKKLDETMKDKIKVLFQSQFGEIEFKCNNCNYHKKIKETIMLYQMNVSSIYSVYRSTYDNKLLALNPIYPRTKDYTCKNVNCITHKDDTNMEAVFFREKGLYQTNYICCVCYSGWKV